MNSYCTDDADQILPNSGVCCQTPDCNVLPPNASPSNMSCYSGGQTFTCSYAKECYVNLFLTKRVICTYT